jgi:Phosphodiester glycosidase
MPARARHPLALALLTPFALGSACSRGSSPPAPSASASAPTTSATIASAPAASAAATSTAAASAGSCGPATAEVAPGLTVQRYASPIPPAAPAGDGCLTVVRIDPARYEFRFLTALADGGSRATLPAWADRFHLTGAINASMFGTHEKSAGLLVAAGKPNNDHDNAHFGGFMAFDPEDTALPPVAFTGRDCAGFDIDALRKRYRSLVQNYRLLDCDGKPIHWKDPKIYSGAAIGMDAGGRVVFLHTRSPWTMTDLGRILASPEIKPPIHDALFVEGGPEASLYVASGAYKLQGIGSYETGFQDDDSNNRFWDLPNILGFMPR